MLANINFHTTSLVDDSTLCAKKDIIINKFDALLKKLGGEVCDDQQYICTSKMFYRSSFVNGFITGARPQHQQREDQRGVQGTIFKTPRLRRAFA
jgi:hypothetical protein